VSDWADDVAKWQSRYGGADYFYGTEPNAFLVEHASAIPVGGAVLCLGEGEGRNAVYLAARGHPVTALDQSAAGLAKAARLAAEHGVMLQAIEARLGDYRFERGHWAGIVSIWCHLPTAVRRPVHRDVVAALAPGGVYVLESYTPAQIALATGGPRDPDLMPTLEQLRAELEGLVFEHGLELERTVVEGAGHRGRSAVVQVVARQPA